MRETDAKGLTREKVNKEKISERALKCGSEQ